MFSEFYKSEKSELRIGCDFIINSGYAFYLLVVRSYPASHETVGSREFFEHVYEHAVAEFLLQVVGCVESCGSRSDYGNFYHFKTHGVGSIYTIFHKSIAEKAFSSLSFRFVVGNS